MSIGNEYRTSNSLIAYPLSENHNIPKWITDSIVDAVFHQAGDSVPVLKSFSFDEEEVSIVVTIDGEDTTFETDDVSGKYKEIRKDLSTILLCTEKLRGHGSNELTDANYPFDVSSIDEVSKNVTSIRVYNKPIYDPAGTKRNPDFTVVGNVSVFGGYNMNLVQSGNGIKFSAIPGGGKGKVPCEEECEETDAPRNFTAEHLLITADKCIDVIPDYENESIRLVGKCVACCQCDEYAEKVEKLQEVKIKILSEKNRLVYTQGSLQAQYSKGVRTFNQGLSAQQEDPSEWVAISVSGTKASPDGYDLPEDKIKGSYNRIRLHVSITNTSNLAVDVSIESIQIQNQSPINEYNVKIMDKAAEISSYSTQTLPTETLSSGQIMYVMATYSDERLIAVPDDTSYSGTLKVTLTRSDRTESVSVIKQFNVYGAPL